MNYRDSSNKTVLQNLLKVGNGFPNNRFPRTGARSKFWGLSGSEDRGGGDNSIQFIKIERVGDKSFKEWRRKIGGGRVGDNIIFDFFTVLLARQKNATLKNCILGNFFCSYL